jgi:putative ABC transport system substrate-binding protein
LGSLGGPRSPTAVAFSETLAQVGYIVGENVSIEFRTGFRLSQASGLVADLVNRQVDVIVTLNSPYITLAAKAATSTIPIVFSFGGDPVKYGLVTSFNRPGGNVTGMSFLGTAGKSLNLLLELIPPETKVAYLSGDVSSPIFEELKNEIVEAGRALKREIIVQPVHQGDFEAAFASLVEGGAGALIVGNYAGFQIPPTRRRILHLAAHHKLPAIYPSRVYAVDGGLMSYSAIGTAGQLASQYVGPILKGPGPQTCPSNYQASSRLCSISRPRKPWASLSRSHFSRPPPK